VERETCCWRFSLIGLRYLNGVGTTTSDVSDLSSSRTNTGIFFQIEFKGLTRFGDQVDNYLSRSISGYRLENEF
jgi:LPS-assembly protein